MGALSNRHSRHGANSDLKIVGLFAGIGGIELGLHQAGHQAELLCEIETPAQKVLGHYFPDVPIVGDVQEIRSLPKCDLMAGGFPCQDLSQAGRTAGIEGERSGLVGEVFRLLKRRGKTNPTWLLLENVPFMLQLDRGKAMHFLTEELGKRGFTWAYRVVDTRAFGLPQRRQRVILLASRSEDPREVLFAQDAEPKEPTDWRDAACGFYWTEGNRGLGWAVDAVPTLKGGSTVGIPSPPAIWFPFEGRVVTPEIQDAERLQGFPADWTAPAVEDKKRRNGPRWKQVGNAVSVPVSKWVGDSLNSPAPFERSQRPLAVGEKWPKAAWGHESEAYAVDVSTWPVCAPYQHLREFLQFETRPLSARATSGFLKRAHASRLRFVEGFLADVAVHARNMGVDIELGPRPGQLELSLAAPAVDQACTT